MNVQIQARGERSGIHLGEAAPRASPWVRPGSLGWLATTRNPLAPQAQTVEASAQGGTPPPATPDNDVGALHRALRVLDAIKEKALWGRTPREIAFDLDLDAELVGLLLKWEAAAAVRKALDAGSPASGILAYGAAIALGGPDASPAASRCRRCPCARFCPAAGARR